MNEDTPPLAPIQREPTTRLFIKVFHSFDEAEPFRSDWDNLLVRTHALVYVSFDWCRIWWKYYGAGRSLHLILCYREAELVGIFPGFIEVLRLGLAWVRAAKLVGSDCSINLCNVPALPDSLRDVMSRAINHFIGRHRCDLLIVGPMSGLLDQTPEYVESGNCEAKLVERTQVLGDACNTFFKLPSTYVQYVQAISKQPRGNLNRSLVQFAKSHNVTFDVVSDPAMLEAAFDDFKTLHDIQWRAEGKLGHFGDWPMSGQFTREVVTTLGALGQVRFYRIIADGKVVSSQYCLAFQGTNYWRLPARVYGKEWDKLSLGRMGLAKMIEACIGEGIDTVEGGRGHYPYKVQFGASELPLRCVQFVRRATGVSLRVKAFIASARLLDLLYYRLLFRRIAPKVPFLRRPLWSLWIRSTW